MLEGAAFGTGVLLPNSRQFRTFSPIRLFSSIRLISIPFANASPTLIGVFFSAIRFLPTSFPAIAARNYDYFFLGVIITRKVRSFLTYLSNHFQNNPNFSISMKTSAKISITSRQISSLAYPRLSKTLTNNFCVYRTNYIYLRINPSNLLTPYTSKRFESHRHKRRTIPRQKDKNAGSKEEDRRTVEGRTKKERKKRGEEGEWREREGDGRDVSWRPTLRGKRSGLPGVPWETGLVAESEFHLRRTKD